MVIKKTLLENDKAFYSIELATPILAKGKWVIHLHFGKRNTLGKRDTKLFSTKASAQSFYRGNVNNKTSFKGYKIIKETSNSSIKSLTPKEVMTKLREALKNDNNTR